MKQNWFIRIILGIIFALIISISALAGLYTDFLWFDALGFSQIFLISLFSRVKLFFATALFLFLFLIANLWVSSKITEKNVVPFRIKLFIVTIISFMVGLTASSGWFKVLQYFNQISFNLNDPIFIKDVSFYVFSLPFYLLVWNFLMGCVVITIVLVLLDYFQSAISAAVKPKKPVVDTVTPMSPTVDFKAVFSKIKT
ncbi:MAG: UPF0182 family protein, partial [Candidatus Woesearchaeota archaeon]|nr:UPF0182 family protein [Candidatus Woesearchaeota archaeon]